jgi:hypothetical protein
MYFELSVTIERPPSDVFASLRDKDLYPRERGSPVLVLDKTTEGPPAVAGSHRFASMADHLPSCLLSKIPVQ